MSREIASDPQALPWCHPGKTILVLTLLYDLKNSSNLQDEDVPANVLGDGEEGVGEGADILVEGIYFAESIGNGGEILDRVGDRVGVVVVGDADPPQLNILRYVADGPFSGVVSE